MLVVAGPAVAWGADVDLEKAINSLVDAERGYNKIASEKGFRTASLQVFADDGIMFSPQPTNGKKYWQKETDEPILTWLPIFATISRDGRLGYTTGPWELREKRGDEAAKKFGHYNTVWRKGNDGIWKVVVDLGIGHAQPKELPEDVETFLPDFPIAHADSVRDKFQQTQTSFAEMLAKDAGAAVLAKAGDEIRVYRRDEFPGVGKTAAQVMLASDHGKQIRTRAGVGMSGSNDLAYEFGEYTNKHGNITDHGIYLSIWQLDLSSDWRLVLDLQRTTPPAK